MSFQLKVYVDPTAALLAGRTVIGDQIVEVTDQDIVPMSPRMCQELAIAITETLGRGYRGKDDLPLSEPSFACVYNSINARIKIADALDEEARTLAYEAEARAAQAARLAEITKAEAGKRAAALKLALHKWIEKNGSESQKQRFKEGLLPEQEIVTAIEETLFESLDSYEKYVRIQKEEACACSCFEDVARTVEMLTSLTDAQFELVGEIRSEAPKSADISLRLHHAKCKSCVCAGIDRSSVRVSMDWNGCQMVREYLLP